MNLYWHRWRHFRGVCYLLHDRPWHGNESVRSTGEVAFVHRSNGRWHATTALDGWFVWTGSPAKGRRLVEDHLHRKSYALFGDDLTIHPI